MEFKKGLKKKQTSIPREPELGCACIFSDLEFEQKAMQLMIVYGWIVGIVLTTAAGPPL